CVHCLCCRTTRFLDLELCNRNHSIGSYRRLWCYFCHYSGNTPLSILDDFVFYFWNYHNNLNFCH
ncbi:hypothetical protein BGX33_000162, partial [Mortierella sp. NVP41]